MDKEFKKIYTEDHADLKIKMLNWANRFNIFILLDNNGYDFEEPAFDCMLAAGCTRSFSFTDKNAFASFQSFFDASPSWLFGHLGYNAAGNAYTKTPVPDIDFGRGFFFEPEIIIRLSATGLEVVKYKTDPNEIIQQIQEAHSSVNTGMQVPDIRPLITKEEYLEEIKKLQAHIKRGDCYEINFCQQFYSREAELEPIAVYKSLTAISPAPFSAFYRLNEKYCMCASPERFLEKRGNLLVSQPIKGTSRRDRLNSEKDESNRNTLAGSPKDRTENVMITDLVRNDLSRVCEKNSVLVKELFGIYSFPQVHHMISTIEGKLAADKNFTQAIEACYPPGSMTGAPKKRVTELIEDAEKYDRGLFSGSLGYITPEGDLDLNVVIRSIFYDAEKNHLSFFAGSGITFYSNAEDEYDECMAKAEAIMRVLKVE